MSVPCAPFSLWSPNLHLCGDIHLTMHLDAPTGGRCLLHASPPPPSVAPPQHAFARVRSAGAPVFSSAGSAWSCNYGARQSLHRRRFFSPVSHAAARPVLSSEDLLSFEVSGHMRRRPRATSVSSCLEVMPDTSAAARPSPTSPFRAGGGDPSRARLPSAEPLSRIQPSNVRTVRLPNERRLALRLSALSACMESLWWLL
ncbi:hypothetical protein AB1Y20_019371 [Prymnesium parvum]|uniref:Uncharacterized protein n=1 Tax=Prymnesium parvum TaxID=97485 RepID=A0AB34JUE9_PRYPA